MLSAIKLISTLCAFGAIYLLVRSSLAAIMETAEEGRGVSSRLDFVHEETKLPSIFRLHEVSVVFLPLVKYFVRTNRFGLRASARELDKLLVKAGLRPFLPPESLLSVSMLLAVVIGLFMSLCAFIFGFGAIAAIFGFVSGGVAGLALPQVLLHQHISHRLSLIDKRLPFAIEFMLLTMEASAAFPTAIEVYCNQFEDDPLAEELRLTLYDIDRGVTMHEALSNMEKRVGSEDLSAFVLAAATGIETGQPIKEVLEVQAHIARQRRYESAEEVAKKASTKSTFPLFLIVIAILLLLLGPVIINFGRSTF